MRTTMNLTLAVISWCLLGVVSFPRPAYVLSMSMLSSFVSTFALQTTGTMPFDDVMDDDLDDVLGQRPEVCCLEARARKDDVDERVGRGAVWIDIPHFIHGPSNGVAGDEKE